MKGRMTGAEAFLRQFDDSWEHRRESLQATLRDVTEEEAAWQAACYEADEREEGWPPPGTIRWQVAHIAHCKRHFAAYIRGPGATERPPVPVRKPTTTLAEGRAELAGAHAEQREAIAALSGPDLEKTVGNGMTVGEFLAMAIRHDTWHTAQIAVARRLWRTR